MDRGLVGVGRGACLRVGGVPGSPKSSRSKSKSQQIPTMIELGDDENEQHAGRIVMIDGELSTIE